jgi:hypothetical protein
MKLFHGDKSERDIIESFKHEIKQNYRYSIIRSQCETMELAKNF